MDYRKARVAATAVQAVLKDVDPNIILDGKVGEYTFQVYERSPDGVKASANAVARALGFDSVSALRGVWSTTRANTAPSEDVFAADVVPAVVREAKRRGSDPAFFLGQLGLESGWGRSTPRRVDGGPSYNFGGLKFNSVKGLAKHPPIGSTVATTSEFVGGKEVKVREGFAVFRDPGHFVAAYFEYLFDRRSQRYAAALRARDAREYASLMQKSGYATDVAYARKLEQAIGKAASYLA